MHNAIRLFLFGSFLLLGAESPAEAVQYSVDGWILGAQLSADNQNLKSYTCKASREFARLTACTRSQIRNRGYNYTAVTTIMSSEDGKLQFLTINVAPVALARQDVASELDELSRELGGPPETLQWADHEQSVVAKWGSLRFEDVSMASNEYSALADGQDLHAGVLIDPLGDPAKSAAKGLPIYRAVGGTGYVYTAAFDARGRGHRQYIALNGSELALRLADTAIATSIEADRKLPENDYSLWPNFARAIRRLARDTSLKEANAAVESLFTRYPSKKYRSRAWPLLPGGAIEHLAAQMHYDVDIYGPKTDFPDIRGNILTFLATKPTDPFVELLQYVVGDFEGALRTNPNSPAKNVLQYAVGLRKMGVLLHDVYSVLKKEQSDLDEPEEVFRKVTDLITEEDALLKKRRLIEIFPDFGQRAKEIYPHFEAVLLDPKTPHADDAAFMIGWMKVHEGKTKDALPYFSRAMVVGNGDYKDPGARRAVLRVVQGLPTSEMRSIIEEDPNFPAQPLLAYVAARSAYREFNYQLAISIATRDLQAMGISAASLPSTTDPERITAALQKSAVSDDYIDPNLGELPYLIQASKEFIDFIGFAATIQTRQPADVIKRVRTIVIKYSTILDDENPKRKFAKRNGLLEFTHRDIRQAIHMIDIALSSTPRSSAYNRLREWLYYRRVRISTKFDPDSVAATVKSMQAEFPNSTLLDDVLAEEIFAEGLQKKDVPAAQATFKRLLDLYPNGNAVDNAYSIMARSLACAGRKDEARKMDQEIIRRFPLTRHADDAKGRLSVGYDGDFCDDDN